MSPLAFRCAAAALAATALLAPVTSAALAQGGPGGGGTPPPSSAPCVKLTPVNGGSTFKRSSTVGARFGAANCSSSPITISTGFTTVVTPYSVGPITSTPIPCVGPAGSGPQVTLAAGEQRTIELAVPQTTCPMGPSGAILEVDATARNAAGAALATGKAFYQLTLRP
jgi:hypothetical protein